MRYSLIALFLTACASEPYTAADFDNPLDYADYYTPTMNCLAYAMTVQKMVGGEVYVIEHRPQNHAVICLGDVCLDNGYLSDGYFDRSDMSHYKLIGKF